MNSMLTPVFLSSILCVCVCVHSRQETAYTQYINIKISVLCNQQIFKSGEGVTKPPNFVAVLHKSDKISL